MKTDEPNEENERILFQCSSKDYLHLQINCLINTANKNTLQEKLLIKMKR